MTVETDDIASIPVGALTHEEALAHFGVKGMRWGYRKAESIGRGTVKVVVKTAKIAGKTAIAALGVGTLAASVAILSDPDTQNNISVGKDYTRLALDDAGLVSMSHLDKAEAVLNIKTQKLENAIND